MLDELRELYQEVILDHGRNPRNHRKPQDANRHAQGHNPMCGDAVVVHLALDENGFIFYIFALSFGIFYIKINVFARASEKPFW